MRVCRACTPNRYTLKPTCPQCGGPTVDPYGSTSTYQRGSGRSLKQLVEKYPPPPPFGQSIEEAVKDIEPREPGSTRYGLIHTLGRTKFDELGGDGAYAKWMQDHFSGPGRHPSAGCVSVRPILHKGPFGSISNEDLPNSFNPGFITKFEELVNDREYYNANTIILNWHIRFTNGTPNGWTGRGINRDLVIQLREICRQANKKFGIVYTVHEESQLQRQLVSPAGLITLNPAVRNALDGQFPDIMKYQSKVPGLLNSIHTVNIDLILKLVGRFLSPIDIESPASNLYFAHGQQTLRLSHGQKLGSLGPKGVVIFGMIHPRHGLNEPNVRKLCDWMNKAGLPADLKIVIAGKEANPTLVKELKALAQKEQRVCFIGQIADFGQLAGYRYAISFDALGYRDNASAMVNVTRAGHLLFSRRGGENDDSLMQGAVRAMALCERSDYFYYELLAQQQPRMRNTSPDLVGMNLDNFFKKIALALSNSH